jgi:uncharacterized protein YecT (DUF1311 family)
MRKPAALVMCMLAALARPGFAQDLVFSMDATDACLAAGEARPSGESCVGASAAACMEASEGGYSTMGMSSCLSTESAEWEARMGLAYEARLAADVAFEAEYPGDGPLARTLREAQIAWAEWRDAGCAYETMAEWGGGSGRGPALAACTMRMNAERARALGWSAGEDTP